MEDNNPKSKNFLAKLFSKKEDITEDQIIEIVKDGQETLMINANEVAMIKNIFEFGDKDAKDIMMHRSGIVAVDGDLKLKYAIDYVNEQTFSRYPVFDGDLDNIIGIFHIKDILKYIWDENVLDMKVKDISGLFHEAEFIPETHGINSIFTKMQTEKNHMVIVVDEYGQTSGLLSMEDILEEIVGEIEDENDDENDSIKVVEENRFLIDGLTSIEEVEELLDIQIEEEFETLNGFLISLYGKIPEDGSSFVLRSHGWEFRVVLVENRTIAKVRVVKLA